MGTGGEEALGAYRYLGTIKLGTGMGLQGKFGKSHDSKDKNPGEAWQVASARRAAGKDP